jgi:hypothetical protein
VSYRLLVEVAGSGELTDEPEVERVVVGSGQRVGIIVTELLDRGEIRGLVHGAG